MSIVRIFLLLVIAPSLLSAGKPFRSPTVLHPVSGTNGAVASADPYATTAGLEALKKGGNAVDAAVATAFTLAVSFPKAGNLGGGGFLIFHDASSGQTYALDFREVAPSAAFRDMFLDEAGDADPQLSRHSPLAIGVPGSVAGLLAAHGRFGSLPLEDLIAPAIKLAREGYILPASHAKVLEIADSVNRLDATAREVFHDAQGKPLQAGDRLVQKALADSLERIARNGRDGFYKGPTAEGIVATMEASGGLISMDDLANYEPTWRDPVKGSFMGHTIVSMPPPSSGGVHLVQMLNLLENFPLQQWGHNSGQTVHIMSEVMKRAYADRSEYLGDPEFVDVPVEALISEAYEKELLDDINSISPTPSSRVRPGPVMEVYESDETTHLSVVDASGNAVSMTTTLNLTFGSGIMAKGTGILLNNEMDDFSAKAGVPNAFDLIGGDANAVEPGKRPLSSMTPTIVLKDGEVRIVTGSPGGSRIITTVLQVILNVLVFDLSVAEATHVPRFHHQWQPDILYIERMFPSDTIRALKVMGYDVQSSYRIGSSHSIVRHPDGSVSASADPRRPHGTALAY
jgi:gamma-glutamyltranspeptidase/glutathione hydrolase